MNRITAFTDVEFDEARPRRKRAEHGCSGTKLHRVWLTMHQRCENPKSQQWHNYGGRGISVCKEWDAFLAFKEWAESGGYQEGLSIDRIDNNGNYKPCNCRWVTQKQQCRNNRRVLMLTAFDETKALCLWAEDPRCRVEYCTVRARLKLGWSVERAISEPIRGGKKDGLQRSR